MKIPFPDVAPEVLKGLPGSPGPVLDNGESGRLIKQGFDQFGEGLATAADSVSTEYKKVQQKAKAEAEAISNANATTEYQKAETLALDGEKDKPGYLETRGLDASAGSHGILDDLEKTRQKIASNTFKDPAAKAKWLAQSGEMYEASRRKVEGHAAHQRVVAGDDALKGGLDTLQQAISNDVTGAETQAIADRGEKMIRSLQLSKEGGDASVLRWRSDVSKTRISSLLVAADGIEDPDAKARYTNTALKQYEASKEFLVGGDKVKYAIDQAQATQAKAAIDRKAETLAAHYVSAATLPDGKVDEKSVMLSIKAIPPGPLRDDVAHRTKVWIGDQHEAYKQKVEQTSSEAYSAFNAANEHLSALPQALQRRLNEQNPALYAQLKDKELRKYRERRGDASEARREQSDLDRGYFQDFMSRPADERAGLDVDATYGGTRISKDGVYGLGAINVQKRIAADQVKKGDSQQEGNFITDGLAAGEKLIPPANKEMLRDYKAELSLRYQELYAEKKGPPSREDLTKARDELLTKQVSKPAMHIKMILPFTGKAIDVQPFSDSTEFNFQRRARERAAGGEAARPPAAVAGKPSKRDRALQLKGTGKSSAQIAEQLTTEGY